MDLDTALHQMLERYRQAVIDAEGYGDAEAQMTAERRRDAVAGILGHRQRLLRRVEDKAQRMYGTVPRRD